MDASIDNLEKLKSRHKEFLDSSSKADDYIKQGKQLLRDLRLQGRYLANPDEREQVSQMARDISDRLFELTGEYLPSRLEPLNIADSDVQDVFNSDNGPKSVFASKNQLVLMGLIFAILIVLILIFVSLDRELTGLISALNSTTSPTQTSTPSPTPTATSTQAPDPSPTPTATGTLTPQTSLCQSARSPLSGPSVDMDVKITFPQNCDSGLESTFTLSGTYSGDLTGKEIWVLVFPTDQEYYPQSATDPCQQQIPTNASGSRWTTIVNLGGPPQQYDIVAIVVDTNGEASQKFKAWLQTGCEKGDFPGFSELPLGITEVDAITVSTLDE